jgi:predicted outer membrane lipoprotein
VALTLFEYRLAELRVQEEQRVARRNLWLAHHWPSQYHDRCFRLGSRPVCRRCAALYPLGFLVALVSAAGLAPWPAGIDPWPIWILSIPATVAYVGEAVGWFRYHVRWQVGTTLAAALAFGRALGYELVDRWHPWFWEPIAVFGAIWLTATVIALRKRGDHGRDQMVAMASSSSSSVL